MPIQEFESQDAILVWVSIGNKPPGQNCNSHHQNGCKTDNRIENLERLNRQAHKIMHSRLKSNDVDVVEIRQCDASGEKLKDIANRFEVAFRRVSKIIREKFAQMPGVLYQKKAIGSVARKS